MSSTYGRVMAWHLWNVMAETASDVRWQAEAPCLRPKGMAAST